MLNPSRPFILRPVATSLLMAAILAVGILGYHFLPLSALPEVDYPTIQVQTFLPGASPDVMTSTVTAPLERQFGEMPGLDRDVLAQLGGRLDHHAAVRPEPRHRRRRAGGAGGDQRREQPAAGEPAGAADLRQGQPGGCADPDARGDFERDAAHPGRGPRRDAHRAEDLAGVGGRPGELERRASARRCASRPTWMRWPPTASTSTICAPRSPMPTRMPPRAASTGRHSSGPSTPTIRSPPPPSIPISSLPTAMAIRCTCATSHASPRAPRTPSSPAG